MFSEWTPDSSNIAFNVDADDGPNDHDGIWVVAINAENVQISDSNNTPNAVLLQEGGVVWQCRLALKLF